MRSLLLNFGGRAVAIYGGPYRERPAQMTGIKLAKEINAPCDIDLPIEDYSVPSVKDAKRAVLQTIKRLAKGETLYAGCWAGLGRTGLFFAILAKVAGAPDPVAFVRSHYNEHAVETAEQQKYVADFPVFWLKWAYRAAGYASQAKLEAAGPGKAPKP